MNPLVLLNLENEFMSTGYKADALIISPLSEYYYFFKFAPKHKLADICFAVKANGILDALCPSQFAIGRGLF